MSNVQWQLNDALSIYEPERAKVFMGYKNVSAPGWSTFQDAFETFGKNLVKRGDLLTPMEQFKIKSGGSLQTIVVAPILSRAGSIQYVPLPEGMSTLDIENSQNRTIRELGVRTVFKVIYERLQVGMQITDFVNRMKRARYTGWSDFKNGVPLRDQTPHMQKEILGLAQDRSVEYAQSFDSRFLPKFRGFLDKMMTDTTTPSKIRRRWKTSNYILGGGSSTVETGMQLIVNASASAQASAINPNVFSRTGDGTQADKELEMVTAAFCRVIQAPNTPSPVTYLDDPSRGYNQEVRKMVQEGLSPFFPILNYTAVPSNYGLSQSNANRRLSLLAVVRGLCMNVGIAQGFGKRRALSRAYEEGGEGVQRMIINAIYPFSHGAQMYDYGYRRYENYIFTSNGHRFVCPTQGFVATMFLMDYLNTDNRLRRHTVNYLAWIKSRCEAAVARSRVLQSGILSSVGPQTTVRVLPTLERVPLSNLNTVHRFLTPEEPEEVQMIDAGVFIRQPGTGRIITPSLPDSSESEVAEIVPEVPLAEEKDLPVGQTTSEQEATAANTDGIDPKYIYIASAVVIAGAISTAVVINKKRSKQSGI